MRSDAPGVTLSWSAPCGVGSVAVTNVLITKTYLTKLRTELTSGMITSRRRTMKLEPYERSDLPRDYPDAWKVSDVT